ncbi:SDR family NAD(P)-dependent oxidoreductase [Henriciella aquimarina]|uniref:SDR family NAD(P)-dependent oxidoreductase n=1 Tax=Henriciella aquimarina TaxID=545261 RepID=UPI0009FF62D6|nr:SDR family NAD(P)-dependent oxidoreductase [Henriciella aquimarina]
MSVTIDLEKALYPDLGDRRVVIAGGTGDVGEGLVRAWLKTGAHVIVPSRTQGKVDEFRQVLSDLGPIERLDFVVGDYTGFASAQETAERITADHGPVTDVVASIGGWWQGKPLWEVSEAEWQRYFVDMTTAHAATARAWVPRLSKTGSYQLILGGSAVMPVRGASIINMQQAALLMMRHVLSVEAGEKQRIATQILGPVITRARETYEPDWVSNDEVGLVTTGIAADPAATDHDYYAYNKTEMLEGLQKLGVYPN